MKKDPEGERGKMVGRSGTATAVTLKERRETYKTD